MHGPVALDPGKDPTFVLITELGLLQFQLPLNYTIHWTLEMAYVKNELVVVVVSVLHCT